MTMNEAITTNAATSGITVERKALKALMRRSDGPGLIYLTAWLAACALTGALLSAAIGTWWLGLALLPYAYVLSLGGYSIAHEGAHGTLFRTRWLNEAVYWLGCLIYTEEPVYRRYTHAVHHSHTWITGVDTQMIPFLPLTLWDYLKEVTGFYVLWENAKALMRGALGRQAITDYGGQQRDMIPAGEVPKSRRNAIAFLAIYLGLALWAVIGQSWLPVLFFFLPRLIGSACIQYNTVPQHVEMATDVADLRASTRSWRTNALNMVLHWNMPYHIEHHLYPTVPFHALPKLNRIVRDKLPEPSPSITATHLHVLRRILARRRSGAGVVAPG